MLSKLYYNVIYGIKNLCLWFKVIWYDRDWDYYYFLKIMRTKLSHMEKQYRTTNNFVGSEKVAWEIHVCVLLLDRLLKDDYIISAFKRYEEKWGSLIKDNFIEELERERSDEERKDFNHAYEHEDKMKHQDLELLLKIMKRKLFEWWD